MWYRSALTSLAAPFHCTDPDKAERILSEGFDGDVWIDYFEEHFDSFYNSLTPKHQAVIDEMVESHPKPLWERPERLKDQVIEKLQQLWYDENPKAAVIWATHNSPDHNYGEHALEVDTSGMDDFLSDQNGGTAYRYDLGEGESRIPASRFKFHGVEP
jgi:hypothetical protein